MAHIELQVYANVVEASHAEESVFARRSSGPDVLVRMPDHQLDAQQAALPQMA